MQQVDIYLSALVSYPQFSRQIIEWAMRNKEITDRNILALRSVATQFDSSKEDRMCQVGS